MLYRSTHDAVISKLSHQLQHFENEDFSNPKLKSIIYAVMCDALRVARDVDKWHIEAYGVAIDYIDESNPSAGFELQFNLWYTINGPLNHFTLYLLDPKTNDDPKVAYDRAMGML